MEPIETTKDGVYSARCPVCHYRYAADSSSQTDMNAAKELVMRHIARFHEYQ